MMLFVTDGNGFANFDSENIELVKATNGGTTIFKSPSGDLYTCIRSFRTYKIA